MGKTIISAAEDHATLLTFVGTGLHRAYEDVPTDPVGRLLHYFNVTDPLGGPLYELKHDFSSFADLRWKLWDSPHLNTMLFKVGAGVAIFDKIIPGVIPSRYAKLAEKVAIGAGASALIFPGSGPAGNNQVPSTTGQGGSYTTNPLSGSSLNSGNPTAGSMYASTSVSRLRGN